MAQLVVRNLEDEVKERLRQRAARHGRSMEEEVREILRFAATPEPEGPGLGTVFEIEYGLELMPAGKRRNHLETEFANLLAQDLRGRIADLDATAAAEAEAGRLMARTKRAGRDYEPEDSMISAIAITRRAILATRNVKHFDDLPIPVVNPWQA